MTERGETVVIVGCGLIGGSIGLALRRRRPAAKILVLDRAENRAAIEEARFADEVGSLEEDAARMLPGANLVILAMPVEVILEQLPHIGPHLLPGTIVTDVGGTKAQISRVAQKSLAEDVHFIGGHPIAGSENAGVTAADPSLFKDRPYVLCPEPETPSEKLLSLLDLLDDLRAIPLTLTPEEHDRILAMISHVPQLLSIALVHAALENDAFHSLLDITVGRGFLDITRIAASRYAQWRGVLSTNRQAIDAALARLEGSIGTVRRALADGGLDQLWETVSAKRRKMTPEHLPRKRMLDIRALIDEADGRILKALGDRMEAARLMGAVKAGQGGAVLDPDRERRLLADRKDSGVAFNLDAQLVEELFEVILRHSKRAQQV